MKKFWAIFGWICLGIFLQFKFNILYGIVFLENLNFHDRTYFVKMNLTDVEGPLSILKVETVVHHSLGKDYFANVYIPENYKVINKEPYLGTETIPGYVAYSMNMKRKYRDVLAKEDFIIAPQSPEGTIESKPVLIHFENMKQRLHKDETFHLATVQGNTQLEGPAVAEAVYPQQLGM
ncbi:hypothetical protein ACTRW9_12455 [Nitrospina sp. 32_T5]|uniref:hypothetical protein n=1 Tax=unclassified Nitrospina TaxID=2638683 RepID=UPI003F99A5AF